MKHTERSSLPQIRCGVVAKNVGSRISVLGFESCPLTPKVGDVTSLSLSFLLGRMVIKSLKLGFF